MGSSHLSFDKRVRGLRRKHRKMARSGTVTYMRDDGLLEVRVRRRSRLALGPLLIFVLGVFIYKAALIVWLGEDTYDRRLALLQDGTPIEVAGAWVMQVDPMTEVVVNAMRATLRPGL